MHARFFNYIFPHIIDTDIHYLDCIKGTSTKMWRLGSVSTFSFKGKLRLNICERAKTPHTRKCHRMPGKSNIYLIKRDRKSTRLNSSHVAISYAVFCLKKKQEV